jgi:histone-lysine N-methyltransferase SUV39H
VEAHAGQHNTLKRKHRDDDGTPSSRTSSVDGATPPLSNNNSPLVYNGMLQRKAGDIYAVSMQPSPRTQVNMIDATTLPTAEMLGTVKALRFTGIRQARRFIRERFEAQLSLIPGPPVTFMNEKDKTTPSLAFKYIQEYAYGEGVPPRNEADAVMLGCTKCRPDMGSNRGCEYTAKCDCLEFAAPDLSRCNKEEQRAQYAEWEAGNCDSTGLPKRFPYKIDGSSKMYVLDGFYLESRNPIYECNIKCRCGPKCKNRLVQKGRTVPLEIFKTKMRGFGECDSLQPSHLPRYTNTTITGLRCPIPLIRGQYIDRYLGELITDAEADLRESTGGTTKASYLFSLDKFASTSDDDDKSSSSSSPTALQKSDCFVADGEKMGGPTRFINHSCDPNCRLFTVSYNRFDQRLYDLAFFALHDIKAGEELTFDYMDPEEMEVAGQQQTASADVEGGAAITTDKMDDDDGGAGMQDCFCGAANCRKRLWK